MIQNTSEVPNYIHQSFPNVYLDEFSSHPSNHISSTSMVLARGTTGENEYHSSPAILQHEPVTPPRPPHLRTQRRARDQGGDDFTDPSSTRYYIYDSLKNLFNIDNVCTVMRQMPHEMDSKRIIQALMMME